ncbi:hypothetical protein CYMTET_19030 [Cymbomonas tetramitiformis]|uniref:Uncharacterized protein n=1 Tax=Cymbomonas tetramitiformis TaxID=36881 RepID=A0AAE0CCF3_9CHLO|nr:hypothetical protein CYMTET_39003 [Cymbomonas tetramitiformis]KAK3251669.1 hypothetical protein CYMTET_38998 [Cymbomonas tetramitiformis]KAK3272692.1 hypothetical protein CYMTET_19030 [Cymbomonas tetramitiformis]
MTGVHDDPEFRNATFWGHSASRPEQVVFLKVHHKRAYDMRETLSEGMRCEGLECTIVVNFSDTIGHLGVATDPRDLQFHGREGWAMVRTLRESADEYAKRTLIACAAAAANDEHGAPVHPEILCGGFRTEDYDALLVRSAGRCVLEVLEHDDALCGRVLDAHRVFLRKTGFVYADNNLENVYVGADGEVRFIDVEGSYLATVEEYGEYLRGIGRRSERYTDDVDTLALDWLRHALSVLPDNPRMRALASRICFTPGQEIEAFQPGSPTTPPPAPRGALDRIESVATPQKPPAIRRNLF